MSISKTYSNPNKTEKVSMNKVKRVFSKIAKSMPKNSLDIILVFSYCVTAIGETFGQEYNNGWYALLILILISFLVREVVNPEPKQAIENKPIKQP